MIPRKTNIICTIGPASESSNMLEKLINAGMDAVRLNFSHGTHEEHRQTIDNVRGLEKKLKKTIPIIQDLQGPKIRIGDVEGGAVELKDGQEFIIKAGEEFTGNSQKVCTTYPDLVKDVQPHGQLLLDDGYIILKIKKVTPDEIITKVEKGGKLKSHKGIIAPGTDIKAPPISEKDLDDLKFGLEHGVDAVALSFVRSERDIIELKTSMKIFGRTVPIIAKIERFEGYSDLEDIIEESEGIMVARGDLGLEMPAERVPLLQKEIIKKCNYHGKFVITATQMLESMINNPRPTRAEASDVANAVFDGTDCVMLSGETSVGNYPEEAVDYMSKIIRNVEEQVDYSAVEHGKPFEQVSRIDDALSKASCIIAEQTDAAAIITLTKSGYTAKNISKYRPKKPIISLTDRLDTERALILYWGVTPVHIMEDEDFRDVFVDVGEFVKDFDFINEGDLVIFVAGLSKGKVMPQNMIKVQKI